MSLLGIAVQSAVFIVVIGTQAAFMLRADTIVANSGATEALWGLQRAALSADGAGVGVALVGLAMSTLRAGSIGNDVVARNKGVILLDGQQCFIRLIRRRARVQ